MKKNFTVATIVITSFLVFLPNVTFSQVQAGSILYQSDALHGVNYGYVANFTSFQKRIQQKLSVEIEPVMQVPMQPLKPQNIVSDFIVSNTNDASDGSLRRAITDANSNAGFDRIIFIIPGSTVHTITPYSPLPNITDPVLIDGATQFGYTSTPLIEIDGSFCSAGSNGLVITAGQSIVRGLIINGFIANGNSGGMGIVLDIKGSNIIEGNYIGTDATGNKVKRNGGSGVAIFGASSNNLIGGTTAAARNVISGNGMSGIQISTGSAGGNRIQGNYIGTSATTYDSLGNLGNGIFIDATGDSVGGNYSTTKNIIADNSMPGIALASNAKNTVIQGNSIGWLSGDVTWGNHDNGIAILGAHNIKIGGISEEQRNLIAANAYPGIAIVGTSATGNIIEGNWIGGSLLIKPTSWTLVAGNSIGVYIENAPGNVIGGRLVGSGNIISINLTDGIVIRGNNASGNRIEGNTIGSSGTKYIADAGNFQNGIFIDNAPNNSIGGNEPLCANYISGNSWNGILINGNGATGNAVKGNVIGISQTDGKLYWGNLKDGILLAASGDTIGGVNAYDGNTIAYNRKSGIYDSLGNHNTIVGNSIYYNIKQGIDLAPRGLTINDLLDADTGANDGQNYPILDSIAFDSPSYVRIFGRMSSTPYSTLKLDFYKSDTCHTSKFGDGQTYIGSGSVVCDLNGIGNINVILQTNLTERDYVTATSRDEFGSTSEFSRALRMLDTDGDGIFDIWEERGGGIDWNCDGVIDLDLWSKNASPFHKDIFVEVDKMVGQLTFPDALVEVEQAFHQIPNKYVNNPDGNDGVNLHAEYDFTSVPIDTATWTDPPWAAFDIVKATHFGTLAERTDTNAENILNAKKLVYRYCIFAKRYSADQSSGLARDIFSKDFIVTLGSPGWKTPDGKFGGTKDQQAGTFMHELGHTLGLRHGGTDDIQYKPNYYSVMNYLWQYPKYMQLPGMWTLNYSPAVLATLFEPKLDELHGFDAQWGDYPILSIPYRRPDNKFAQARLEPKTPVDWDGDNDSSGYSKVPVDINHYDLTEPIDATESLSGYADWPNLIYSIRNIPASTASNYKKKPKDNSMDEMTPDIYKVINDLPPYGILKPLSHWSNDSSRGSSIATGYFSDFEENAIGNGEGGAIISWRHAWSENSGTDSSWDIRAQMIDSLGKILWDNNGISISKGEKAPQLSSIVSDGSGGAIITWEDVRLGSGKHGIFSQHLDKYGREQWPSHGIAVTPDKNLKYVLYPTSISDRRGGAIIMWNETDGVYAQRIDVSGTRQWTTDGLFLIPNTQIGEYNLLSDGAGGAIVLWKNRPAGGPYYFPWYAQRIDSTGTKLWGTNGIQVSPTTTAECSATEDKSGGAIVVFTDIPTDPQEKVCLQRIRPNGSLRFPLNGVQLDTVYNWAAKYTQQIIQDDKGMLTIGWVVKYNGVITYDLFLQRVDTSGVIQWPAGGIHAAGPLTRDEYSLVGTKNRKIILLYTGSRDEYRAKYFDSTGILPWSENGVTVNHGPGQDNSGVHALTDNGNGATVVYASTLQEIRSGTQYSYRHIYAQHLNENGGLGEGFVTGMRKDQSILPKDFELMQNYPNPFNPVTKIRFYLPAAGLVKVEIFNILGQRVATILNHELQSGMHEINFNGSRLASGIYIYTLDVKNKFFKAKKMILIK